MVHPIFKHDCQLAEEIHEENIAISPYASPFRKMCFRAKQFLTIYKTNDTRQYFRSHASFLKEKNRHLGTPKYRYVIHPFSKFVIRERIIICFVWLAIFIICPYKNTFLAEYYISTALSQIDYVLMFLQALLIIDIISRFFIGYPIEQTGEIVLDPKRIWKRYLLKEFVFDAVPTFVTVLLIFYRTLDPRIQIFLMQTHMLRGVRIRNMVGNLDMMLQLGNVKESIRTCLILSLLCFVIIHWWTCIIGFIPVARHFYGIPNNDSWNFKLQSEREKVRTSTHSKNVETNEERYPIFHNYLQCMTVVLCHFFGAGSGRYSTNDSLEMLFFSFILINGVVFFLYARATVLELFGMVNISETKYEHLVTQTSEYMVVKRFPSKMKERIFHYYEYKFNKTFFSEQKILASLSEHLRMEILLYSCRNLIDKVQMFKGLSRAAIGCILALLKQEIYLAGDVILDTGDKSGIIYLVLYGTCAMKMVSGKETMHIEDGNLFGNSLEDDGSQQHNLYTVVAVEPCEIYSLSKNDIKYCCINYPEITHKLEILMNANERQYYALLESAQQEEATSDDIVAELRRGHILHQGRRRSLFF